MPARASRRAGRPAARAGAAALALLTYAGVSGAAPSGTALDCLAAGYEVRLTNPGPETVDPGQVVDWEVRFVRKAGAYEVTRPLGPGEAVLISGALGSDYLAAPQPCTATLR